MPTLTNREKRTVHIALVGLVLYLALFFGVRTWHQVQRRHAAYQELQLEASRLAGGFQLYQDKAFLHRQLKERFRLDPKRLSKSSLVAEASGAIQRAAASQGIQLGPMRESPARSSARELTSMQLEGIGPLPAVMSLLHRLEVLGFPLIVDAIQLSPGTKPGEIKVNLTIVILDFEQWSQEGPTRV